MSYDYAFPLLSGLIERIAWRVPDPLKDDARQTIQLALLEAGASSGIRPDSSLISNAHRAFNRWWDTERRIHRKNESLDFFFEE